MNIGYRRLKPDEIEINIKNICKQCIKRIKGILLFAIVVAIILSGLVYYKDLKNYNENMTNVEIEEITDADKFAIDKYSSLKSKVDQLLDYRDNAIVMDIDFNNTFQSNMQFAVKGEDSVREDVVVALADYVNNGGLASDLKDTETFSEKSYIQEIIKAKSNENIANMGAGVFSVTVYGASEKDIVEYANVISNKILEYAQVISETLGANEVVLTLNLCSVGYSQYIYDLQQTYLNDYQNYNAQYESQLAIVAGEKEDMTIAKQKPSFSIKVAVVGLVLGIIIGIAVVCLMVIFGGKIQSEKEILRRLDINNFGSLDLKHGDSEQYELLKSRICLRLQNAKVQQVVLVGTTSELLNETIVKLKTDLNNSKIECEVAGNILENRDALENMVAHKNVIIVEEIGKTKISDIYETARLCKVENVAIHGYITITM